MNPRTILTTFFLAACAAASAQNALALAQGFADAEAKAIVKGDVAWYRKNLAPGYVETGKDGKTQTKAQTIAKTDAQRKMMHATRVSGKATRAAMVGGSLVATLDFSLVGNATPGDGKTHAMTYRGTVESTWAKRGGAWQKTKERTLREGGTIDGKAL